MPPLSPRGNFRILVRQRGFGLLEAIAAIAVLAFVAIMASNYAAQATEDQRVAVSAQHMVAVANAARAYVAGNYAAIQAVATPTTPATITVPMLISTGYLPTGFLATNNRGSTVCVHVLEPVANQLNALAVAVGGTAVDDMTLGQTALLMGAAGGGVYAATPTKLTGAQGGWTVAVTNYAKDCGGVATVLTGRPAYALWFGQDDLSTNTLYRDSVPGRPDLNQMNTPILMGSVQTVGAACAPTGAMARDSDGAVVSCQFGAWKAMGDGKCVATSADLNVLHNDGRCYNGVGNANSPAGGEWFFLEVYRHVNQANFYTVQRVMGMTGSTVGKVWHRNQQSNTAGAGWSAWVQQADDKVSIWSQPAEGGVVTITANDGNKMHLQTAAGGRLRLVNSPWNTELASFDQSGNLTLNQSTGTNVGYINPGWAAETWGCSANGSIAKSAYNIVDGWAWNGKPLTCQNGVWSSAITASTLTLGTVVTENTGCSPNGMVARDGVGLLLSCQSGVWKGQGQGSSKTITALSCDKPAGRKSNRCIIYFSDGTAIVGSIWGDST